MAKERIIRKGKRRVVGRFLDDDTRMFHIADNKSNIKGGLVKLPAKTLHEEVIGLADTLTLTMGDVRKGTLVRYWLSTHEFLAYAKEVKGQYVVPLYNFKSRRI